MQDFIKSAEKTIRRIEALPPDEQRAACREILIRAGILDKDGNVTEPYKDVFPEGRVPC